MEHEDGIVAESGPVAVVVEEVLSAIPADDVRETIDHAIDDAQLLGPEYTLNPDELIVLRAFMCMCISNHVLVIPRPRDSISFFTHTPHLDMPSRHPSHNIPSRNILDLHTLLATTSCARDGKVNKKSIKTCANKSHTRPPP